MLRAGTGAGADAVSSRFPIASTDIGFPNRYPWMSSHPAAARRTRCNSVSTPSAMTSSRSAREAHDGIDDRVCARIRAETGNERAVDLDLVDGITLQVAQAGIAGAEVVEGDAEADRLQIRQCRQGRAVIAGQKAFRDLEFVSRRRSAARIFSINGAAAEAAEAVLIKAAGSSRCFA